MAFGGKKTGPQISASRLAAVSGGGGATATASIGAGAGQRRRSVEPDLSRIRKNRLDETPDERKKRLAAKTVNYTASFIARIIIFLAAGYYAWTLYQTSGDIHRGVAIGMFAMAGDFFRVVFKAMEPGGK